MERPPQPSVAPVCPGCRPAVDVGRSANGAEFPGFRQGPANYLHRGGVLGGLHTPLGSMGAWTQGVSCRSLERPSSGITCQRVISNRTQGAPGIRKPLLSLTAMPVMLGGKLSSWGQLPCSARERLAVVVNTLPAKDFAHHGAGNEL